MSVYFKNQLSLFTYGKKQQHRGIILGPSLLGIIRFYNFIHHFLIFSEFYS